MVLKEELRDDVYFITFNRPERKNAFNFELLKAFYQSLCSVEERKAHIVVLRSAGGVFGAGGDISGFRTMDSERMAAGMELVSKIILKIRSLGAIAVAVLEGPVAGMSVGLSLACDLSVAAKNAYINLAFRRVGLAPDGGVSMLVPRIAGVKKFNEFFLFARDIPMEEAKRLGLVNFVWELEGFEENLQKMVTDLKALPMESIRHFKELANNSFFSGLEAQLKQEQEANVDLFSVPSFKTRLEAMFARK